MEKKILKFPEGFLWGVATSAYQVEGGNTNDWSEWEKKNAKRLSGKAEKKWQPWQKKKFPEMFEAENYICDQACDHYNRYEEDFDIAKSLNLNAFRISIEWSRIEPEEGKFNEKEIEHYRKVIEAIRARGMEPFVCLWHWTNPLWLARIGGPANKEFSFYFGRYTKYVAENFKDLATFWLPLNEPTSVIAASYVAGVWPPQKKNPFLALKIYKNLARAHLEAYAEIKKVNPLSKVSFANILIAIEPHNKKSLLDKLIVKIAKYFSNEKFINLVRGKYDFLTVQYYFHKRFKFPGIEKNENKEITDLNWEIYPEGIYHILKDLKKYNLPIYVTENGLADARDEKREKFIKNHLHWIHKAIQEGMDVRGYFYWSLLDNFEWDKGFWPRFGLVEINYKTMERKIRPSAYEYAKICKENKITL
ncbi:glycoside hydrolase family 1 protein [bacterium]|nr:MAG: glycoside hydrolase family 1 protein [bacterium]